VAASATTTLTTAETVPSCPAVATEMSRSAAIAGRSGLRSVPLTTEVRAARKRTATIR
jgi:hypothetical protein